MLRTISIKLDTSVEQSESLRLVQQSFTWACNYLVPIVQENRCWNRKDLHHAAYYQVKAQSRAPGSQMICNAIRTVCDAYKVLKLKRSQEIPTITFRANSSVHYDKRTYSLKHGSISLYTLDGRMKVLMLLGDFQKKYLEHGKPREAELICKQGTWFFNLVLELVSPKLSIDMLRALGVDLGENNTAATSSGKLYGGGKVRHARDRALALRRRLQSNGSKSAKQLLQKISGKEARHMRHVNHCVSKAIVADAIAAKCNTIALEKLTNIRKRIKAGKRMRSRLHRWAWAQLQNFITYKAEAAGLLIKFVNPAYTSKTCSVCGKLGIRTKHRLKCDNCGIQRHSDLNASLNIRRIAESADSTTGTVNYPNVAPNNG